VFVLVTGDFFFAVDYPNTLAPTADEGGIGSAVGDPACAGMIVPGPAGGEVDLQPDNATKTLPDDMLGSGGYL
jgi:hypothetical protein